MLCTLSFLMFATSSAVSDLLPALSTDDECKSDGGSTQCALDALQRKGMKLVNAADEADEESSDGGQLNCIRHNFYYREKTGQFHMRGTSKTMEHGVTACQERCYRTNACYRFTFWPDGGCLLTSYGATPLYHRGVMSGPRACSQSSASTSTVVSISGGCSSGACVVAPDSAWVAETANYTDPPTEYVGVPDAWDSQKLKISKGHCSTAQRHSRAECYDAVLWARNQGIWEDPAKYPGLVAGASSVEEFQFFLHTMGQSNCPPPCLLEYPKYSIPSFRVPGYQKLQGISYGAAPLKSTHSRLTSDDFMADITGAQLFSWGRGDMNLIKNIGANAMRMYGNDANTSHRTFLDESLKSGIDIIAGMSDFGFIQGPDNCILHNYYCYDEAYFYYKKNLLMGFTVKNFTAYHPALKALIMANEPDLKVQPRKYTCRATASIFDAILQAEKDVGVTGNPIALTFTWSFANFHGPRGVAALGQMEDFWKCIQNPSASPSHYTPKNDLVKAFRERFVNSFNTANKAEEVKQMLLDKYGKSTFWTDEMKIPVFIGEYHSIRHGMEDDLTKMMSYAKTPEYPFFMGYSFFEFSVRYDKGGSEAEFGMFGYGDCILMDMNYTGQTYTIWNLIPNTDKRGYPLVKALKNAFGTGRDLPALSTPHLPCQMGTMGIP